MAVHSVEAHLLSSDSLYCIMQSVCPIGAMSGEEEEGRETGTRSLLRRNSPLSIPNANLQCLAGMMLARRRA